MTKEMKLTPLEVLIIAKKKCVVCLREKRCKSSDGYKVYQCRLRSTVDHIMGVAFYGYKPSRSILFSATDSKF